MYDANFELILNNYCYATFVNAFNIEIQGSYFMLIIFGGIGAGTILRTGLVLFR